MTRSVSSSGNGRSLGSTAFLLAMVIFGVIGYFIADYYGVQQRLVGMLTWLVIFGFIFTTRLIFYAMTLLPEDVENRQEQAFNLIWQHYFSGKINSQGESPWEGVPPSLVSFRAGVVDSHVVLAIGRGQGFSRAAGPGYVQLEKGEFIKHVIDLRDQQRSQRIELTTRDGIPLRAKLVVTFRLKRLHLNELSELDLVGVDERTPYPHDATAVFQVSYFSSYGEGEQEISWRSRIVPLVAAEIIAEIANYTLDEVYQLNEPEVTHGDVLETTRVTHLVQTNLSETLQEQGIELVHIELNDITLPEDVYRQRIANWQTHWQNEARLQRAKGDAQAQRLLDEARAEAEIALINQMLGSIEEAEWAQDISVSDVVMMVAVQAMEQAAVEMPTLIPSQMIQTLSQLQLLTAEAGVTPTNALPLENPDNLASTESDLYDLSEEVHEEAENNETAEP